MDKKNFIIGDFCYIYTRRLSDNSLSLKMPLGVYATECRGFTTRAGEKYRIKLKAVACDKSDTSRIGLDDKLACDLTKGSRQDVSGYSNWFTITE